VNYYIASKLMWDPKTDVDAALKKYCALVFGNANADAAAEAFLTIEASRDVENQVSPWIIKNPAGGAARAQRARQGLSKIQLSQSHRSRLPSVVTPQEMLEQMRGALEVIADNADLCAGPLRKLDALIASGKMDEAKALRADLEKKAGSWFGTIAGGMEGLWLKETLQAKFTAEAVGNTKEILGFETSHIVSLEEKDSRFLVKGDASGPATAVRELTRPETRKAEFQFSFKVAPAGKSRNGGIAFGPGPSPDQLLRCMVYVRGQRMEIQGKGLVRPARVDLANLDPDKPITGSVTVDLEQHRVTFKAGDSSAHASLAPSVREIRWYGYAVDRATTQFSPIEVKHAQ
jgi:hypothetical protein